jgi:VanZ family protein
MPMPISIYRILSSRLPALTWTIIIFVLLALPGKMLPDESHMGIPQLDKYVHLILFGSFVFLWSFYFSVQRGKENLQGLYLRIVVIACLYGTAMEFIQKYFIPNRDFDLYDIAADVAGAIGGYIILRLVIKWNNNPRTDRAPDTKK